jgi:hypothetical protein
MPPLSFSAFDYFAAADTRHIDAAFDASFDAMLLPLLPLIADISMALIFFDTIIRRFHYADAASRCCHAIIDTPCHADARYFALR